MFDSPAGRAARQAKEIFVKFLQQKNKVTSIGTCMARGKFAAAIRSSFSCWISGHEDEVKEKWKKASIVIPVPV